MPKHTVNRVDHYHCRFCGHIFEGSTLMGMYCFVPYGYACKHCYQKHNIKNLCDCAVKAIPVAQPIENCHCHCHHAHHCCDCSCEYFWVTRSQQQGFLKGHKEKPIMKYSNNGSQIYYDSVGGSDWFYFNSTWKIFPEVTYLNSPVKIRGSFELYEKHFIRRAWEPCSCCDTQCDCQPVEIDKKEVIKIIDKRLAFRKKELIKTVKEELKKLNKDIIDQIRKL